MSIKFKNIINILLSIHWLLLLNFIVIFFIGIAIQYSSTGGNWQPLAYHQLKIFFFFFPLMIFMTSIRIETYIKYSYLIYLIVLILLISVNVIGFSAMGATRWLRFRSFNIQPSEFAKIAIILTLSSYFYQKNQYQMLKFKTLCTAFLIVLPFVFSILKQPNLGTAIIVLFIAISIFFTTLNKYYLIILGVVMIIISVCMSDFLYEYQKKRIISFLNPTSDPFGIGYNTLQSQIAIGSGGAYGKGFMRGTQAQLNFVPEKQTDFVFTVLSEEWGFVGILIFFFLYTAMVYMMFCIALNSRNVFSKLVSIGIASFFSLHFFINIAMVTGIIPVVGVPLPLLSYGGSITATSILCIGILLSIHANNRLGDKK